MTEKFIRTQLKKMQSRMDNEPISVERKGQELLGRILQMLPREDLQNTEMELPRCRAAMIRPKTPDCDGAVLYLHGGGYCCGDLAYAKGFGSVLAAQSNCRVFCPAYRLAPEHPFPAALDDAMDAYRFLLASFAPEKLVLAGESAGGGLIYCLCLRLKQEGLPLPGGLVGISPWSDLTGSGLSYRTNAAVDPSMTPQRLRHYASLYTDCPEAPLASPLFGDLCQMPESLLFAGGDEIMLDDAVTLHGRLLAAGCRSTLTVAPGLWHAYVLYGLKERKQDLTDIAAFIRRIAK